MDEELFWGDLYGEFLYSQIERILQKAAEEITIEIENW